MKINKDHIKLSDLLEQIKSGVYSEAIAHCRSQKTEKDNTAKFIKSLDKERLG